MFSGQSFPFGISFLQYFPTNRAMHPSRCLFFFNSFTCRCDTPFFCYACFDKCSKHVRKTGREGTSTNMRATFAVSLSRGREMSPMRPSWSRWSRSMQRGDVRGREHLWNAYVPRMLNFWNSCVLQIRLLNIIFYFHASLLEVFQQQSNQKKLSPRVGCLSYWHLLLASVISICF